MKAKLLGAPVALALFLIAVAPLPAAANPITYAVTYQHVNAWYGSSELSGGSITTDGALGVLQPEDILSWTLSTTQYNFNYEFTHSITFGSDTGTLDWAPGALVATDYGITFIAQQGNYMRFSNEQPPDNFSLSSIRFSTSRGSHRRSTIFPDRRMRFLHGLRGAF